MAKQRQLLSMMKIGVSASFITLFILLHGVFSVYLSQKKAGGFLYGKTKAITSDDENRRFRFIHHAFYFIARCIFGLFITEKAGVFFAWHKPTNFSFHFCGIASRRLLY